MRVHVYVQQNNAVIGYFITWLCNNNIDATATNVSTTREQRVKNMACLDDIYSYILAFSGLKFLELLQVVYI